MPQKATETGTPRTSGAGASAPQKRGREVDDPVSLGLRKLWEHVEKEPIPDSFLALLDAIDASRAETPAAPPADPSEEGPA